MQRGGTKERRIKKREKGKEKEENKIKREGGKNRREVISRVEARIDVTYVACILRVSYLEIFMELLGACSLRVLFPFLDRQREREGVRKKDSSRECDDPFVFE